MTTRAAPSPATEPRQHDTTGTVARFATTCSQPGLNGTNERRSVSSDFTEPPPPEPSTSRTIGSRSVAGHALGVHLLLEDRRVGRAAPNREVVAADHDGPTVDAAPAHDEVRRA